MSVRVRVRVCVCARACSSTEWHRFIRRRGLPGSYRSLDRRAPRRGLPSRSIDESTIVPCARRCHCVDCARACALSLPEEVQDCQRRRPQGGQVGQGQCCEGGNEDRCVAPAPIRSPSLMPLDYSLRTQIDAKMAECEPTGRETKLAFLARLKRCARSLPKATVRKTARRMKASLSELTDARGFTPKNA